MLAPGCRNFLAWIITVFACLAMGCAAQKTAIAPRAPTAGQNVDSLCTLADSAVSQEEYIEAMRLFEAALEADPHHLPSLRGSAALHEKMNDPHSAKFYYTKLTSMESPRPSDYLGLSRAAEDLSDEESALAALEKAASLFPDHHDIHYQLGTLHAKRSQLPQAAQSFKRALQIDPGSRKALLALGNIEFDRQNFAEARRHLESLLTLDPSDFRSNMRVAYIHFQDGDYDRALPYYRQALESNSASIDARVGLASTLEKLNRPQAAIRAYKEAIGSADDLAGLEPVILALADLLNKQHEFESTVSLLHSLAPEAAQKPALFCALGIALAGKGDYAGAVHAFEKAVGHPRWGPFAKDQIERIKRLKSYEQGN